MAHAATSPTTPAEMAQPQPDEFPEEIMRLEINDIITFIEQQNQEIIMKFGAVGAYRCVTCRRLAYDHPDGSLEFCALPLLDDDEFLYSLRRQLLDLTNFLKEMLDADANDRAAEQLQSLQIKTQQLQKKALEACRDIGQLRKSIADAKESKKSMNELEKEFTIKTTNMRDLWRMANEVDEEASVNHEIEKAFGSRASAATPGGDEGAPTMYWDHSADARRSESRNWAEINQTSPSVLSPPPVKGSATPTTASTVNTKTPTPIMSEVPLISANTSSKTVANESTISPIKNPKIVSTAYLTINPQRQHPPPHQPDSTKPKLAQPSVSPLVNSAFPKISNQQKTILVGNNGQLFSLSPINTPNSAAAQQIPPGLINTHPPNLPCSISQQQPQQFHPQPLSQFQQQLPQQPLQHFQQQPPPHQSQQPQQQQRLFNISRPQAYTAKSAFSQPTHQSTHQTTYQSTATSPPTRSRSVNPTAHRSPSPPPTRFSSPPIRPEETTELGNPDDGGGEDEDKGKDGKKKVEKCYPGLYEIPKYKLMHQTDGRTVGGIGDFEKFQKFKKIWTGSGTEQFKKEDNLNAFLRKRSAWFAHLDMHWPQETIYTLVTMFSAATNADYSDITTKLNLKKSYFTSFEHYFREFEHEARPYLQERAMQALERARQHDKEALVTYYTRYDALLKVTKQDPDNWAKRFVMGIRNQRCRDAAVMNLNGKPLTFVAAYEAASSVECYDEILKPPGQKKGDEVKVVNAVTEKNDGGGGRGGRGGRRGRGGGRGGGRAGGGDQRPPQSQQQQQQGPSTKQEGGKGGKKGRRGGGGGGGGAQASANVSAVQAHKEWYEEQGTIDQWISDCKGNLPATLTENRCMGCLGQGHQWDLGFSQCPKGCPFCKTWYLSKYGHPASLCSKLPQKAEDILACLE